MSGDTTTVNDAGGVVRAFYASVVRRDFPGARRYLDDQMTFVGLFETYSTPAAYLTALTGLMSITTRLEIKTIIGQGDEAAVFFELDTTAPAAASTLVAEWHRVRDGRIVWARSAFDGRPFEAMFKRA